MFKTFVLQIRRNDLTHEQYVRHWLKVHAPLSSEVEGLAGYVANEIVGAGRALELPRTHPGFGEMLDGIAQLHFADRSGLDRIAAQPAGARWLADGPNFVGRRTGFVAAERTVQSPARHDTLFKLIAFFAAVAPDFEGLLQACAARPPALGLVRSDLGPPTGSTNLPGLELPAMEVAVEVWKRSGSDAVESIADLAAMARRAGCATLVAAVLAREHVIRPPLA